MSEDEILQDFLTESNENLDQLDRELVALEKNPRDAQALASIFRTVHTVKGTCGFLGFNKLEKVAHAGENLLTLLRDGKLRLSPQITTALLSMVDAIRGMLRQIQSTGKDGADEYTELIEELHHLQESQANGEVSEGPSKERAELAAKNEAPAAVLPDKAEVAPTSASGTAPFETIRVGVNLLDNLMNRVGELVLARNQLLQFSNRSEDTGLQSVSQRMNLIVTELQEEVMKTRMQPIGNIWNQFPRTVRDVALNCGKEVDIGMEGQETELDKTIIEAIKDPLTHLVRNSVDHGIEFPEERVKAGKTRAGRLLLHAFHESGQVNIEISDDGAGLNRERIRAKAIERGLATAEQAARFSDREVYDLIFHPGFSTAEKITKVSGRGVGMDVVKTNVEKIGGTVDVQSRPGQGTTVRIKIPLTLAIIPALVVTCGGERFAIPQVNLTELVQVENNGANAKRIETVHGAPVYRLRGRLLPLLYLNQELQLAGEARERAHEEADGAVNIVVLQAGDRQFGMVVDEINDTQEIVVKPLQKQLKGIKSFAGASIMGDGKIALILDVMGLAQRSGVISVARDRALAENAAEAAEEVVEKRPFLLFAGPDAARMAVSLAALDRLEELAASQVEQSGSQWVAQYRGHILPLVHLGYALNERRRTRRHPKPDADGAGTYAVLVCQHEGQLVGIVVEKILDIVEDAAQTRYPASRAGVLCSAVIDGRVTELLDIPEILRSAGIAGTGAQAAEQKVEVMS